MTPKLHAIRGLSLAIFIMSVPVVAAAEGVPLITGMVTDRDTGQPVANARVFFYGSAYGTVSTDASGTYTFTDGNLSSFGGALSGNLYAGANGYFEAPAVFVSDLAAQPTLPVVTNISLRPGGALLQGIVRDAVTGAAIPGATISFSRSPMSTYRGGGTIEAVISLADGSYAIDSSFFNEGGLSAGFAINLNVNVTGYLGRARTIAFTSYPTVSNFDLPSIAGTLITGIVTDGHSGEPIANAGVFFYGSAYGTVFSDSNGQYSFTGSDLSIFGGPISGTLYVGADDYFEAPPISVTDLSAQPSLPVVKNVSLLSAGPVIEGVVRDATTGNGIAGATVSFNRSPMSTFRGGGTTVSVMTRADGSYAIDASFFNESGLASGFLATLQVNASGYLGASRSTSFTGHSNIQHFNLQPNSGTWMTGIVTDRQTGLPIADATVFFYGSAYGMVTTDAAGRYTFLGSNLNLFGGAISGRLYVGKPGFFEAPPIDVSDLGAQPSLPVVGDVSLQPGGVLIVGTVRDGTTGVGVSGATVAFNRSPMSTFRGGGTTESVLTLTDGTYSVDSSFFNESGLSSGFSASLHVNATRYLGASQAVAFTVLPTHQDFSLVSLNRPPMANAGNDQLNLECDCPRARLLTLSGAGSFDPDLDALTYTWTGPFPEGGGTVTGPGPAVTLPLGGPHSVTLTVDDGWGAQAVDTLAVSVADTIAPVLTLVNTSVEVARTTPTGASVDVIAASGAAAVDICDPSVTLTHDGQTLFPRGTTTVVTITATDASGNTASRTFSVTVTNGRPSDPGPPPEKGPPSGSPSP